MTEDFPFRYPDQVIVTVGRTDEAPTQSRLSNEIYAVVDGHSDRDVGVQVRYIDIDERGGTGEFDPEPRVDAASRVDRLAGAPAAIRAGPA